MVRIKKMATVAARGNRVEQLENLKNVLAREIDACAMDIDGQKLIPSLAKQYRETIKEIEEIRGVADNDEIGEILSARKADGKPDAVR